MQLLVEGDVVYEGVALGSLTLGGQSSISDFMGLSHSPLGESVLSLNGAGNLVVDQIGASGNDGVQVAIPGNAIRYEMEWLPVDPDNQSSIGAFLEYNAIGVVNDVAGQDAGTSRITKISPESLEIATDFTSFGSDSQRLEIYNDGSLVQVIEENTSSILVEGGGASFPIIGGKLQNGQTKCIIDEFASDVGFHIEGFETIIGDELRILAENGDLVDELSSFQVLASGISSLEVTRSEAIVPEPSARSMLLAILLSSVVVRKRRHTIRI